MTLDDDILARVKLQSRSNGASFQSTLNDLLRTALSLENRPKPRVLKIEPHPMGFRTGLNHDHIESLLEYGEGELHR